MSKKAQCVFGFGQGADTAAVLTNHSKYVTIITDEPYFSRHSRSYPLARHRKGSRPMHSTTFTYEISPQQTSYISCMKAVSQYVISDSQDKQVFNISRDIQRVKQERKIRKSGGFKPFHRRDILYQPFLFLKVFTVSSQIAFFRAHYFLTLLSISYQLYAIFDCYLFERIFTSAAHSRHMTPSGIYNTLSPKRDFLFNAFVQIH